MKPVPWSAVVLSILVLVSATAASLITLFWRGSFPDPSPATLENRVLAEARGWSAATLLVAIPLAILSLRAACRGSLRGRLVWLGVLAYFVYTYLEFAVSPPFTALYLLYAAAFACAIPALVIGAMSIDLAKLSVALGDRVPRLPVGIFSLLYASLLAIVWLKSIASQTLAGAFGWPVGEDAVAHVVHALDLGLQVPLGIAAGVMLLRRNPAGLCLAGIMLVNVVCMGAALTAMVLGSTADAGTSAWIAAPFALVWLVGVTLAVAFFRSGMDAARTMSLIAWLRRHPLLGYFAAAYGISWGGILIVLCTSGFDLVQLRAMDTAFIFVLMLLGPSTAGLAGIALLQGRHGLRELRRSLMRWRVGWFWYAVALLTAPGLLLAVLLPLSAVDAAFSPSFHWPLIAIGLVTGSFEEIGWTGFAAPRLVSRQRLFMAGSALGLVWALWHGLVDFRQNASSMGVVWLVEFALLYVASLTAYRVLMTWVFAHTQSVLLAVLMHASYTSSLLVMFPSTSITQGLAWQAAFATLLWTAVAVVTGSAAYRAKGRRGEAAVLRPQALAEAV